MRKFSILMVDADEDNLESMRRSLQKEGRLILTACSTEAAAAVVSENTVDMMIIDFRTSKQGGGDFMRNRFGIHQRPGVPVIMLSSDITLQTKLLSYVIGAKKFFPKPLDMDELTREVARFEIKNSKEAIA